MRRTPVILALLALMPLAQAAESAVSEKAKIKVLVVPAIGGQENAAQSRLGRIGLEVAVQPIDGLNADTLAKYDVVFLPTAWAQTPDWYRGFQDKAKAFLSFVEKGGGLVVGQPNPYMLPDKVCTPNLLPYPVTFHALWEDKDKQRINLSHQHFITEDLRADELPHPTDRILKIDRDHYQVLVLGGHTESASLAVVNHGKGRVVVLTGNESEHAVHPCSDRFLQRIFVWAARREPERFREKKP